MEVYHDFELATTEYSDMNPTRIHVIRSRPDKDWLVYRGYRLLHRRPTQLAAFREAEKEALK